MLAHYKLKSRDLFSDLAMGAGMFVKGKIHLVAPRTKNMKAVRNILEKTAR
jgi:hypothetical protein